MDLIFSVIGGIVYCTIMIIILAAGLVISSLGKSSRGFFVIGGTIQGLALMGEFQRCQIGQGDFLDFGIHLAFSVIIYILFVRKDLKIRDEKSNNKPLDH